MLIYHYISSNNKFNFYLPYNVILHLLYYYVIYTTIFYFIFNVSYIMPTNIAKADVSFQMDSGVELLSKLRSDRLPVLRRAVAQGAVSHLDRQKV